LADDDFLLAGLVVGSRFVYIENTMNYAAIEQITTALALARNIIEYSELPQRIPGGWLDGCIERWERQLVQAQLRIALGAPVSTALSLVQEPNIAYRQQPGC
jgi:hypothetical protein